MFVFVRTKQKGTAWSVGALELWSRTNGCRVRCTGHERIVVCLRTRKTISVNSIGTRLSMMAYPGEIKGYVTPLQIVFKILKKVLSFEKLLL